MVAGCCALQMKPLQAQAPAVPFSVSKQYSAVMTITPKGGAVMTSKICADNGKMRTEMATTVGGQFISIIRPDLDKVYTLLPSKKIAMEMPYDPNKFKAATQAANPDGTFVAIGPDPVDGVACTKYKMTDKDGKVFFFWVDTTKKSLVKMTPEDGTVTITWSDFVSGPQDASLFEVPDGYQKMNMPTMPGGAPPSSPL